ncbi:serine hydrolase [Pusillimonas sp. ANT_WB101]|uniref:serine hydrolase n=1 Tax=Pusillimonas sp. ANT_WB101 TaxID=2597356 RepID=UPI0011EBDB29|nr:serine hydrolase [Pusillimonas sp. ANT_WB101]KAA0911524.1 serine hydrolase [Pusillimonas sp. ANT_WB101]
MPSEGFRQNTIKRCLRARGTPLLPGSCAIVFALGLSLASSSYAYEPVVNAGTNPALDAIALADNGLSTALAALPKLVQDTLDRSGVPGAAVAVVHNGVTVFAQGFGVLKMGQSEKIKPSTVFQIASISKSLTASVIAVEVTKKVVSWDDAVVRYLPGFEMKEPYVTAHASIGDFMAHRSGLPFAAGDALEDLGYDRTQIIEHMRQVPLDAFRTSYHYANFGTTIAGEAVAAAAKLPWEDLAEQALFKPLGMQSTSARHADYLAHSDRAVLHTLKDGKFQPLYDRTPDAQAPAGGVSSNVLDMAQWMKFLLANGKHNAEPLASAESLVAALSPHAFSGQPVTPSTRPSFYGYGFNVGVNANGRTSFGHSGAFLLGAATAFQILPSADLGIVVLTNGAPVGVPESINANFMDTVQFGKPLRDWYAGYHDHMMGFFSPEGDLVDEKPPVNPQPAQPLETYTGQYESPYFGPAEITLEGNKLVLAMGPAKHPMPISHWNGNTFAVMPLSENAPTGSRSSVAFTVEQDKVNGFTVNYLNQNGLAIWHKTHRQ